MRTSSALSTLIVTLLALLACHSTVEVSGAASSSSGTKSGERRNSYGSQIAPPLEIPGTAYEFAGEVELPEVEPKGTDGLHNVFHLSENIVSGSEPAGPAALQKLASMGIKTIISVDGKIPDAKAAAKLGMRYVHIPIQYKGITSEELINLSKTFRELQAPFYVHCFHGRHRGPAGAAVGRIVRDGLTRDLAIAEMRQYFGTSSKYEGLYRVIASGQIPTAEMTAASEYDFEAAHRPDGMVGVMIALSRAHDNVAMLSKREWKLDPQHPDVDAINEAQKLHDAYVLSLELPEVQEGPQDLREWFEESRDASLELIAELRTAHTGDAAASGRAVDAFLALKADCSSCHRAYRN